MLSKELLGPENLFKAKNLGIHEAIIIVVICEDKHLVFSVFQMEMPYLKSFDNS